MLRTRSEGLTPAWRGYHSTIILNLQLDALTRGQGGREGKRMYESHLFGSELPPGDTGGYGTSGRKSLIAQHVSAATSVSAPLRGILSERV